MQFRAFHQFGRPLLRATDDVGKNESSLRESQFGPIGCTVVDGRPTLGSSHEERSFEYSFRGSKRPIDLTGWFFAMTLLDRSRRSFLRTTNTVKAASHGQRATRIANLILIAALKTSVALAGTTPLIAGWLHAQSNETSGPLIAYVGTYSSPLRDVLPTQVDLPPGNGRGIHLFQ